MQASLDNLTNSKALGFVAKVESIFKGLPHLPSDWRDFLVKIAPYGALIGGVFSIYSGLASFGLGSLFGPMRWLSRYAPGASIYFVLSGVIMLASGALMLLSYKPLAAKQMKGWIYMFWIAVINLLNIFLGALFLYGAGLSSLIGVAVGFYLLFEIKSAYTS
ncbi:MAG: hypothetical protein Q8N84_00115 [bacterium]|nr:hypothetical protein [bacterium]